MEFLQTPVFPETAITSLAEYLVLFGATFWGLTVLFEGIINFRLTLIDSKVQIIGGSITLVVLATFSEGVRFELFGITETHLIYGAATLGAISLPFSAYRWRDKDRQFSMLIAFGMAIAILLALLF